MTTTVTMYVGDVRDVMADLPDGYADLLVTSPPFLALRSYLPADHPDKHREIGSEPTPAAFLDTLYGLTADWGRLLPEWGSICVELGDTMSGSGGAGGDYGENGLREGQGKFDGSGRRNRPADVAAGILAPTKRPGPEGRDRMPGWPLAKSMCILPHAYTLGLAYGHNPLTGQATPAGQWRIRNVIAWARPNPPVGALGKRNPHKRTGDYKFRPATSFITVACRGTGRYFDLDAVRVEPISGAAGAAVGSNGAGGFRGITEGGARHVVTVSHPAGAPPLDWHTDNLDGDWLWKLATAPYPGAHYATYPLTLPRRLVLAMCPLRVCRVCGWPSERVVDSVEYIDAKGRPHEPQKWASGIANGNGAHSLKPDGRYSAVRLEGGWTDCGHDAWRPGHTLDPFGGSGTTAVAAALEGRDATLIDLDHRNIDLVRQRLHGALKVLSEDRDGDVIRWTVEPASTVELEAIRAGQTSLFDEASFELLQERTSEDRRR